MRYGIGYGSELDDNGDRRTYMLIERLPTWAALLGTAAELLCRVTRHRFCSVLCVATFEVVDRRAERFEVGCPPERVAAFAAWRGWDLPWWFVGEDAENARLSADGLMSITDVTSGCADTKDEP